MSYDAFLYEVRDTLIGEQTLRFHVKIGYYEPRRWKDQNDKYQPGMAFAAHTEVCVEDKGLWNGEGESEGRVMEIRVSQTGNSLVSIEEAELRAEVNTQALHLAYFIRDQLDMGVGLVELVSFLKAAFYVGNPVPAVQQPFRYNGSLKASLNVFSHDEVARLFYG